MRYNTRVGETGVLTAEVILMTTMDDKFVYESVNAIARRLIFNKYIKQTVVVVIVIILFSIWLFGIGFGIGLHFLLIFLIVVPSIYYGFIVAKARNMFMRQFAVANSLYFEAKGSVNSVSGRLFRKGNSRQIYNVLSGTHGGYPIRLFNFNYSIGSGKNKQTYYFTVCEITFSQTRFPHILLQSRTMARHIDQMLSIYKGDTEVPLEDEFKKSFRLFTRVDYEIEALQIFTNDMLRFLQEKAHNFSIEFAGNNMYIYDDIVISNKKDLQELLDVNKRLIETLVPFLERLHDDYRALDEVFERTA